MHAVRLFGRVRVAQVKTTVYPSTAVPCVGGTCIVITDQAEVLQLHFLCY